MKFPLSMDAKIDEKAEKNISVKEKIILYEIT